MELGELSEEVLKIAAEELDENPETRATEIQTLRKRILLHPELKMCTDDAYLLRFLRAAAFDQEAAFTLINKYFEMKADDKMKTVFTNLRPSAVKHVLKAGVTGELNARDNLGRRVMVFRPGKWDPANYDITDVVKTNFMTFYKFVEDEETQVRGVVVIFDLNGLGFGHITHISPTIAKRIVGLLQDSFPMRFQAVHFVNEPAVFDYLYAIIKQFMKQETIDKVILHGHNLADLAKYFDVENLPEDFGGKAPPYSNEDWMNNLLACDAEFDAEAKNGIVKPSAKEGSGTYRKLES